MERMVREGAKRGWVFRAKTGEERSVERVAEEASEGEDRERRKWRRRKMATLGYGMRGEDEEMRRE